MIVGSIPIYYFFEPSISLEPLDELNPRDSFSVPYFISNEGFFAIYDIATHCRYEKVETIDGNRIDGMELTNVHSYKEIEAHGKATVAFQAVALDGPFKQADMTISISYRPKFLPFSKLKKFRFIAKRDSTNQLRYFPQPIGY